MSSFLVPSPQQSCAAHRSSWPQNSHAANTNLSTTSKKLQLFPPPPVRERRLCASAKHLPSRTSQILLGRATPVTGFQYTTAVRCVGREATTATAPACTELQRRACTCPLSDPVVLASPAPGERLLLWCYNGKTPPMSCVTARHGAKPVPMPAMITGFSGSSTFGGSSNIRLAQLLELDLSQFFLNCWFMVLELAPFDPPWVGRWHSSARHT